MKIAFIGSGRIGAAIAYTAALKGVAQEIILTDISSEKAKGEALDIFQGQAFFPPACIRHGEIEDTAHSDIIVISAGMPRKADELRVTLLARNASLIADITKKVVDLSPQCILLMITNPLDVMTSLAYRVSGLPAERVIGMGTVLDTARYRSDIARQFRVDARDIDAYIVGEHGETMVPLVSNITVKGVPLPNLLNYEADAMTRIANGVRSASSQVIALKGGTVFAPAIAACTILEAIVHDSRQILPVSTFNKKYQTAVSLPTIIGRHGAGPHLVLPMSQAEEDALALSIANIKKYADEVDTLY